MRLLFLVLIPAMLLGGPHRFARLSEVAGTVEVQVHAADAWVPGVNNTALVEGARVRCALGAHAVVELEEGSTVTLAEEALVELSDYARLSSGQRITLVSVDHGLVYVSGHPGASDSFHVTLPGAEVMLRRAARVRFDVSEKSGAIAILDGTARFSTPMAELELKGGQMVEVTPGVASRFRLLREIPELDADRAEVRREEAAAGSPSARYLPGVRYGAADLDAAGTWHETEEAGVVWKPKADAEFVPFRAGRWRWYEEIGYCWAADEAWGWAPYHYGRWLQSGSLGWVWSPGVSGVFQPGAVYWMRGNGVVLWGPLAPEEIWTGAGPAQQYAALNSTLGRFAVGVREIASVPDAAKPKELLAAAVFALGLPGVPFSGARLEAVREPLRSSPPRAIGLAPEVQISGASFVERPAGQASAVVVPPVAPVRTRVVERPVYVEVPVVEEVFYPFPVYSGFVVLNPPVPKVPVKKKSELFKP